MTEQGEWYTKTYIIGGKSIAVKCCDSTRKPSTLKFKDGGDAATIIDEPLNQVQEAPQTESKMVMLEKMIHEKLTVVSATEIAETPKGFMTIPASVHDSDGGDTLASTKALKNDSAKAVRTLADYAQALNEIAATADILSRVWGIDAPEFARIAKSAKATVKKLKGV